MRYATLPWLQPALAGLAPAVIVVMAQGAWRLGRDAVRSAVDVATMVVVFGLALAGVNEVALLAGAAVVGALLPFQTRGMAAIAVVSAGVPLLAATGAAHGDSREPGRVLP